MKWLLSVVLFSSAVLAANPQTIKDGPVHEAYLTPVAGEVILQAVAGEPPAPIVEQIPERTLEGSIWVPGYWGWSAERQDFVWVSGTYRKPPPGTQWNAGYWKHFDEGWVWLRGFWSRKPLAQLDMIVKAPPKPLDENVGNPQSDDFFWMSGYWKYAGGDFTWLRGRWVTFNEDWVWVPAHYEWRPGGYLFIEGYWDYPIDKVGMLYANLFIPAAERADAIVLPVAIIEPEVIIQRLFLCYPDYICWYHHHFHFHLNWWSGWCCTPPWWGWASWWSFSPFNQWGIWWWWGHPGFPQPWWLTLSLTLNIEPPAQQVLNMLKGMPPPPFVNKKGVVSPDLGNQPILPADPRERERILDEAARQLEPIPDILRPGGTGQPSDFQPNKPNVVAPGETPPSNAGRVAPPPQTPTEPGTVTPPIRRPSELQPREVEPPPRQVQPRPRPQYRPRPRPERPPQQRPRRPRRPRPEQTQPPQSTRPRPRPSRPPQSTRPRPRQTPPSRDYQPRPELQPRPQTRPQPRPSQPTPRETPQTGPSRTFK